MYGSLSLDFHLDRVGATVLPEKLLEKFREYKRYADTSQMSQAALEVYIKKRHVRAAQTQNMQPICSEDSRSERGGAAA